MKVKLTIIKKNVKYLKILMVVITYHILRIKMKKMHMLKIIVTLNIIKKRINTIG